MAVVAVSKLSIGWVVASGLLVGCAPSATPSVGTASPEAATPQKGGTVQILQSRGMTHLDPLTQPGSNGKSYLSAGVYDELVDYEYKPGLDWRQAPIVPELAESWEQPDPSTYVFRIRKGVKWHDGQPLTAADVQSSVQFIGNPANKLAAAGNLTAMESVSTVDEYTVRLKLKEPDVDFLKKLTNQSGVAVVILPKHVRDRGDSFEKVAVGTGPFKVEAFSPNSSVTYVANPDHWRPGLPYADRWRMVPAPDESARTAAFFAGQNDVVKVAARSQADAITAQNREAQLSTFIQDINVELWLKLDRPPFNDLRVRRAVHLAVDRQAMLSTLTAGDGLINPPDLNAVYKAWAIPAGELATLPGWRTPKDEDLARARQLLGEAGYGQGLSFTIKADFNNPNWPQVAEMVASQMRTVGVDAKLQPLESAVFQKAFVDGDYQAASFGGESNRWFSRLHSKGVENTMPIRDAELDRLLEAQAREFDEGKRAGIMLQIQRLMLRQVYTIPTITYPGYTLLQPWVHGWLENQGALPNDNDWGQLWLDGRAPSGR